MINDLALQTAFYMAWWTKTYDTNQQQIDADRRLRELLMGTR